MSKQQREEQMREIKSILRECASRIKKVVGEKVIIHWDYDREFDEPALQKAVCEATGLTWERVTQQRRNHDQIVARQLYCWFAYTFLGKTKSDLGRYFNQDHTTIINAIRNIDHYLEIKDREVSPLYKKILRLVNKTEVANETALN